MAAKTILIAEDDRFLLKVYKARFSKEGYQVFFAQDGEEALQLIQDKKPDLALLDILMPKKTGLDVLEGMGDQVKTCKVIVLSNLSQGEDIDKATDLGAIDYIIKSDVSIEEVVDKVKAHL